MSQYKLLEYVKTQKTTPFRGIFMTYTLPSLTNPWKIEYGILILDSNEGEGIHRTGWIVENKGCFILIAMVKFLRWNLI